MKGHLLLIMGMTIVTYLPRLIPLLVLKDKKINSRVEQFLTYIPFTSLSILIIRGIIGAEPEVLLPTLIGIGVAGLVAWIKNNLVLSVLSGILASLIVLNIL